MNNNELEDFSDVRKVPGWKPSTPEDDVKGAVFGVLTLIGVLAVLVLLNQAGV